MGTVLLEIVLLATFLLSWRYYEIPQEIYNEQAKRIKQFWPDTLDIIVQDFGIERVSDEDGKYFEEFVLEVRSGYKNKQVIELEARVRTVNQTLFDTDTNEPMTIPFFPDERILWENGNGRVNLRPDDRKHIQLGFLAFDQPQRVYFGERQFTNHLFERESVYQIDVQFMGKLEGETEFRQFNFMQVYYSNPTINRLSIGHRAIEIKLYEPLPIPFVEVIEAAKKGYWKDFSSPFRRQQDKKRREIEKEKQRAA